MALLMSAETWLALLCGGYVLMAAIGFLVMRARPWPARFFEVKNRFSADPLTVWVHERLRPIKSRCWSERRWYALTGLILFNVT